MEVKSPGPVLPTATTSLGNRLRMAAAPPPTFPRLLDDHVRLHGDRVFLPRRHALVHEPVTFAQLCRDVDALAAALLDLGVGHGDRIGLIAENRYEWLLVDLAIVSIGAIDVPRGSDTAPAEVAFILAHSGARFCFCEDDRTAREVLAHRDQLPALERLLVMADKTAVEGAFSLGDLLRAGAAARSRDRLAAARSRVQPDDLLTIVYTSGTTAEPKGVMLSHRNVLTNASTVTDVLQIGREDVFLSVLPAWHMYERIMDYLALAAGGQLVYTDRRRIKEDLGSVQPTVFAAVPRIWEMLHDGIVAQAMKLPGAKGALLRGTIALCRRIGGGRAHAGHHLLHLLARATVLRKVRALTGPRLRLAVSGGGSLPRHVDECLLGFGLPLLNGYGLTETSPVAAVRLPHANGPGHIGPPLPDTAIEPRDSEGRRCAVGQTGVLWIRGPQVMRGYYQNARKTAEVLDGDGWFNSGDLGHVDANGRVWITGRAKDTIVLAGGENVEPEPIEAALKTSPYVQQVMCVGQDQKHLGALLVPLHEALEQAVPRSAWDVRDGVLHGKAVQQLFRAEFDRLLTRERGFRSCDRVAVFAVLDQPFTPENGLLTQTLKIRRHKVAEQMQAVLARLFAARA